LAIVAALGAVGAGVAIFGGGEAKPEEATAKPSEKAEVTKPAEVAEKFIEKKVEVLPDENGITAAERVKIDEILAYWYPSNWDRHSSVPGEM